jgi:hypothetical protein
MQQAPRLACNPHQPRTACGQRFSHLGPNKKMPHRRFEHVQAIEHLIDVFRANVLLRFAKQRAVQCHDIHQHYLARAPLATVDADIRRWPRRG